jgi:hypothetical protein
VLATPLTVCLVVLGRHLERFEFLDVMLGDRPALSPSELFYQRMLAGDPAEAVDKAGASSYRCSAVRRRGRSRRARPRYDVYADAECSLAHGEIEEAQLRLISKLRGLYREAIPASCHIN